MTRALILVDLQNDFCPGGALAVARGDETIAIANKLIPHFQTVIATQDWHPKEHKSFAVNNGAAVGSMGELDGMPQVMWPAHCVQGTRGAEFHADLAIGSVTKIFQKGTDVAIDSYSGFFDNGRKKSTGLGEWLRMQGVDEVVVLGLATDYCVKFTTLDAIALGLRATLVEDGCRAVNLAPTDGDAAIAAMRAAGATITTSDHIR